MSKRRQSTTGLPKAEKKTPPPSTAVTSEGGRNTSQAGRPLREHQSRAEREAQVQRYVILGTGIAVVLVVVLIAIALIVDQVINPGRSVASVNGEGISVRAFEQRVRLERLVTNERVNNGIATFLSFGFTTDPNEAFGQLLQSDPELSATWNQLTVPDQLGLAVLNKMIDEQLIRDEAEARGISVTEAEIEAQIDQFFNYDPERVAELEAEAAAAAEATPESTAEGTPNPDATAEIEVTADAERTAQAVPETTLDPNVTVTPTITPTRTPFVSPTPSPTATATPTPTPTVVVEVTGEATAETTATITPTPFPTIPPAPTQSAADIRDAYDEARERFFDEASRLGLSRAYVTAYFEGLALREKLRDIIGEEQSTGTATWANARHILVPLENPERAQDILDALSAGESFAALARASSTDTGSGANGGELGWANIANYVEPFRDAVRDAAIGAVVGPVESEFGYHIIQVRAREERPLEEFEADNAVSEAFTTWLENHRSTLREAGDIETNSIWTDFVPLDPVFVYEPR